jgi:hypothetical protein
VDFILPREVVKSLKIVVDFLKRSMWTGGGCEEILLWDFFALLCVDTIDRPDGKDGVGAATAPATTAGECRREMDSLLQGSKRIDLSEVP